MTRQESFKRRIRSRMEKTGERYGAARRTLLQQSSGEPSTSRRWVSEPETGGEAVRSATGRGWDEWCDEIDRWPGRDGGHAAIAGHVAEQGVDGWWAQTVALGYERITGRRLPHQQPDGTFTANKTRTARVDAALLRALLLDDGGRADLFPGLDTRLRSRAGSKAIRVGLDPGTALIALDAMEDGRTRISVSHEGLPSAGDVETWKGFWSEWLAAVADD